MIKHVWKIGDTGYHRRRRIFVEVVRVIGSGCVVVVVKHVAGVRIGAARFATSTRWLNWVEDCTDD
jgi:hypothetical protein